MRGTRIRNAGIALLIGLTLTACAPTTAPAPGHGSVSATTAAIDRLPVVTDVFGPAKWSATSVKGQSSAPLVLSDRVVITQGAEVVALDASGKTVWKKGVDFLPDSTRPNGQRTVIAATPKVVAVIDQGTLPKGSDALAKDSQGTRVTLLNADDGCKIAEQTITGDQIERTTGLAFTITTGNNVEYVAVTPDGKKHAATVTPGNGLLGTAPTADGPLPLATVGDSVIWGAPYSGNMGVLSAVATGLPLENSTVQASDGRGVVVLSNSDATAWVNLTTGKTLTPDASCTKPPAPQALHASPDGAYVVGGNAIANVTKSTITCVGGGDGQKAVTWDAVADDGTAYGRTADTADTFVVARGGDVKTYPIPADARDTMLVGFTSDGVSILLNSTSGLVNGNPVKG